MSSANKLESNCDTIFYLLPIYRDIHIWDAKSVVFKLVKFML